MKMAEATKEEKNPIPYDQFVEYDRLTEEKNQKYKIENDFLREENKKLKDKLKSIVLAVKNSHEYVAGIITNEIDV